MMSAIRVPTLMRRGFAVLCGCAVAVCLAICVGFFVDLPLFAERVVPVAAGGMQTTTLQTGPFGLVVSASGGAFGAVGLGDPAISVWVRRTGLVGGLVFAGYFAFLFDLLRRMFRNVERRRSFTVHTVRLVQILGVSVLLFAVVASVVETWACQYLVGHLMQVAPSVRTWNVTARGPEGAFCGIFFGGLLISALSEVFRQGLQLQQESDLTV